MGVVLQTHQVQRRGRGAFVHQRNAAGRQQTLGLQLFATQADDHHLAAEVGVQADVAQCADRDLGTRCVDGHTAAVGVLQRHHIVHVRVLGQQLGLDALHGEVGDPGHTLHGLGDGQDVAGADRTVGIAVTLEGVALQRGLHLGLHGGDGQVLQPACIGHVQQALVHPAARRNGLHGVTNGNAVTQHRAVGGQVDQRHLVALRHLVAQHQAAGQHRASGQTTVVGNDGDVVAHMHTDGVRRAGGRGGGRGCDGHRGLHTRKDLWPQLSDNLKSCQANQRYPSK